MYFWSNLHAPHSSHHDLYRVKADRRAVPERLFRVGDGELRYAAPDGSRSAVIRDHALYLQDADGIRRALAVPAPSEPTWAPNSSQLAVISCARSPTTCNVVLVDAASGRVTTTPIRPGAYDLAWALDAHLLAFSEDDEVGIYDPVSGRLAADASVRHPGAPIWNPSGTRVAFKATPDGGARSRLYVLAVGSNDPVLLRHGIVPVSWSLDGSRIAYTNDAAPDIGLRSVTADGLDDQPLFPARPGLVLSPDWEWVAFWDESFHGRDLFIQQIRHGAIRVGPSQCSVIAEPCRQGSDFGEGQTGGPKRGVALESAGNDWFDGRGGNDRIEGSLGNDHLDGGDGQDVIFGGYGDDKLIGGPGADWLRGDEGHDHVFGDDGPDRIGAEGGDWIDAGPGNDAVFARNGARDVIHCGSGIDRAVVDRNDVAIGCERLSRR